MFLVGVFLLVSLYSFKRGTLLLDLQHVCWCRSNSFYKYVPQIVDLATLTGACIIALGPSVAGIAHSCDNFFSSSIYEFHKMHIINRDKL